MNFIVKTRLSRIEVFMDAGDFKKAEHWIERTLRSLTDEQKAVRVALLVHQVRLYLATERPVLALKTLDEINIIQPSKMRDPDGMLLLADAHLERYAQAAQDVDQAAKRDDCRIAQKLYQQVIDQFPDHANLGWAYCQRGRAYLLLGQAHAAESAFHKALFSPAENPALTAFCYERLGYIAFYESRQAQQAITYLNKAVDTYPQDASRPWLVRLHLLRSRIYREIDAQKALEIAQLARNLADNLSDERDLQADVRFNLAELSTDDAGQVIQHLDAYLDLKRAQGTVDVRRSRACELLGDAHFSLERYEQAAHAYEDALTHNPYHPWAESLVYRQARALYQAQRYQDVVLNLQRFLEANGTSEDFRLYRLLGNAFYGLKNFQQAAQAYEMGIRLAPIGADIQTMRAYYQISLRMR